MSEKKYCYEYPRPAVTADCILFGTRNNELFVLLIERGNEPFKGSWAFPGGFIDEDETIEACAARELKEETGLEGIPLEQFYTFSEPGRDPRGRTISVAFMAYINIDDFTPQAGDDAANLKWFPVNALPQLAFDHEQVLVKALNALEMKTFI
jgi:8-oxo-dGTP diphosphatase